MRPLSFGVNESMVRAPFFSLHLTPETPFRLSDEKGTPWAPWLCDRFTAFIPLVDMNGQSGEESLDAFMKHRNEETAVALAKHLQGFYSFDGSLAYIPASHADDFYRHLEGFVNKGLSGRGFSDKDKYSDELTLGDESNDVVAYWGSSTADGLFLLFAMSVDALGEDWFESALDRYPRREEIIPPAGTTEFDPRFAFIYSDSHLADHLYPDRQSGQEFYASFLGWARQKGYLAPLE